MSGLLCTWWFSLVVANENAMMDESGHHRSALQERLDEPAIGAKHAGQWRTGPVINLLTTLRAATSVGAVPQRSNLPPARISQRQDNGAMQ
jgi:hypothetical protein